MRKLFPALLLPLLVVLPAAAGDDGLTGYWKFTFYQGGSPSLAWLIRLDSKDGKLTASAQAFPDGPQAKIEEVKQTGDTFQIRIKATFVSSQGEKANVTLDYEGKLPKVGAKKILGSISAGSTSFPAVMEATTAKTPFEVERDILQRTPTDPKAFSVILEVIEAAKDNKLDAKDLQELVDGSLKAGEAYGPRYQMSHSLRVLKALSAEKNYPDVTLETARRVAKQIDPKAPADQQLQALSSVLNVMRSAKERTEVAALEKRIDKLEDEAHAEYAKTPEFKAEKFKGRKGTSKRAVLVELFTGATCPPCVAADMAFDGLERSYSDKEVVLLQYHMHIPRPEPMSNADCDARFEYYADNYRKQIRGTPSILFNGKPEASGGGSREDAADKYQEYCKVVNKLLESTTAVQVEATAVRKDDTIDITAKVSGLDKVDNSLRLRIALVEDWVRFKGSNGMQYHHRVVRALPGGIKGFALKEKSVEQKATIDLTELRRKLNKYLDEEYGGDGARPMRLRNLHVVAFVQNDDTTEVLQAVDTAVREGK